MQGSVHSNINAYLQQSVQDRLRIMYDTLSEEWPQTWYVQVLFEKSHVYKHFFQIEMNPQSKSFKYFSQLSLQYQDVPIEYGAYKTLFKLVPWFSLYLVQTIICMEEISITIFTNFFPKPTPLSLYK